MSQQVAVIPSPQHASVEISKFVAANAATVRARGLKQELFARQVAEAIRFNPKMKGMTSKSLALCARKICETGLIPDGEQCSLVPFAKELTFIPGWRGMAHLAYVELNGDLKFGIIREGDIVNYTSGVGVPPTLEIKHANPFEGPNAGAKRKMIGVWCSLHLLGNEHIRAEEHPRIVLLTLEDINEAMARSPAVKADKKGSPWFTDYEKMARKTAVKEMIRQIDYMLINLPTDRFGLRSAVADDDWIEAEVVDDRVETRPAATVPAEEAVEVREDPAPAAEAAPVEVQEAPAETAAESAAAPEKPAEEAPPAEPQQQAAPDPAMQPAQAPAVTLPAAEEAGDQEGLAL